MHLIPYSPAHWDTWDVGRRPLIPAGMPVLIDEDLLLEEAGRLRPSAVANLWLRERPINRAPAPKTWRAYAQALRNWLEFLAERGIDPFDDRAELRLALSMFSEYHFAGPLKARWERSTWNQTVNTVARFYGWATDEGFCVSNPFTYSYVRRYTDAGVQRTRRNNATVRLAKPHAGVQYLEGDFVRLFLRALAGLRPDGEPDSFRGRHLGRNAAMAALAFSSGLRAQEFTHLLIYELPRLPARRTDLPIRFPLAAELTKGKKARETWTSYDALIEVDQYCRLDRAAVLDGRLYTPNHQLGPPLTISDPDWEGGNVNGYRVSWRKLTLNERLRLVTPDGQPAIIAVQSNGTPFVDWRTLFRRTSARIRRDFEPRFPRVSPHVARHSFAMATLERLVKGHYARAAALIDDTHEDAALALYLTRQDPPLVLRDLLGHTSVTTTEIYLQRLDVQRIYREAYRHAGGGRGTTLAEAASEFDDDEGDDQW